MSQQSLAELKEEYKLYKSVQLDLLTNKVKEYTIKERSVVKLGLPEIERRIDKIVNDMAKAEVGGKIRVKKVCIVYDT